MSKAKALWFIMFYWHYQMLVAMQAPVTPALLPAVRPSILETLLEQYKRAFPFFLQVEQDDPDGWSGLWQRWIVENFYGRRNDRLVYTGASKKQYAILGAELYHHPFLAASLIIMHQIIKRDSMLDSWCMLGAYHLFHMLGSLYNLPLKIDGLPIDGITPEDNAEFRAFDIDALCASKLEPDKQLTQKFIRYSEIMLSKLLALFSYPPGPDYTGDDGVKKGITIIVQKWLEMCLRLSRSFALQSASYIQELYNSLHANQSCEP